MSKSAALNPSGRMSLPWANCPSPERAPRSWCFKHSSISVTMGGPGAGTTRGATGLTYCDVHASGKGMGSRDL
eukprot:scaffold135140_cov31-Tisochrysis_lutea.AAC.2